MLWYLFQKMRGPPRANRTLEDRETDGRPVGRSRQGDEVMAYVVMAYIVMAQIVMAYVVMARHDLDEADGVMRSWPM